MRAANLPGKNYLAAGVLAAIAALSTAAADELLALCIENEGSDKLCKCVDEEASNLDVRAVLIRTMETGEALDDDDAYEIVKSCRLKSA